MYQKYVCLSVHLSQKCCGKCWCSTYCIPLKLMRQLVHVPVYFQSQCHEKMNIVLYCVFHKCLFIALSLLCFFGSVKQSQIGKVSYFLGYTFLGYVVAVQICSLLIYFLFKVSPYFRPPLPTTFQQPTFSP